MRDEGFKAGPGREMHVLLLALAVIPCHKKVSLGTNGQT
jgi:hypothetical protein